MEQLLRPYRRTGGRRAFSTAKSGSLLKASIPTRTFAYWDEDQTGFLEMNLVAHRGETTDGFYLNTLSTVDISTGWVECQAVWGKGQDRVGGAVHHVARSLSFPLSGLDSDNGGIVHQPASIRLLPAQRDQIHTISAPQEERQRPCRAEELVSSQEARGL